MNFDVSRAKISVTMPVKFIDKMRTEIFKIGAGNIGNYTNCSICTKCKGTFKPSSSANPHVGEKNKLEFLDEIRLEINCDVAKVSDVIKKIKEIHPYEEPVIDIIPLFDESNFK